MEMRSNVICKKREDGYWAFFPNISNQLVAQYSYDINNCKFVVLKIWDDIAQDKEYLQVNYKKWRQLREIPKKYAEVLDKEYPNWRKEILVDKTEKKKEKKVSKNLESSSPGKKSCRAWCGTCNNYTENDEEFYKNLKNDKSVTYFVMGYEVGESGTPHLQMFIYFKQAKSFSVMCNKYCKDQPTHWRNMRTNHYDSANYCRKDGKFIEFGEQPKQGGRSDLDAAAQMVKDGKSMIEIGEKCPGVMMRYSKGIQTLINLQYKPRTVAPQFYWFWGESGSGKTYTVEQIAKKPEDIYMKANTKWWEGYKQQQIVLFDEYDGWLKIRDLNQLLSHHTHQVEVKGGSIEFNSPIIIITSDRPPHEVYGKTATGREFKQLYRRIEGKIFYFNSKHQRFQDGFDETDDLPAEKSSFVNSAAYLDQLNKASILQAYQVLKEDDRFNTKFIDDNINQVSSNSVYSKLKPQADYCLDADIYSDDE